jgi:hypothetical protein
MNEMFFLLDVGSVSELTTSTPSMWSRKLCFVYSSGTTLTYSGIFALAYRVWISLRSITLLRTSSKLCE